MKFTFIIVSLILLGGCGGSVKEGTDTINCGANSKEVSWRVRGNNSSTNQFAIMLNGSPATQYFSEQSPQSAKLVDELIKQGYKVFEVKYPTQGGFYSLCFQQGLDNVSAHCAALYDLAVEKLNFDSNDPKHKLVGVGWSIGAIQLQAMSFMHGRRIDNIALTGILLGNAEKGCKSYRDGAADGYSWGFFHNLAAYLTKNGNGCIEPSEYNAAYNFENLKHFQKWNLGLFEGKSIQKAGNLPHAQYIADKRRAANAPVKLFSYENCGHELLECTEGKMTNDILDFLASE